MPTIAVIDDRKPQRETLCRLIKSTLRKLKRDDQWTVIGDAPPSDEEDVLQWLDECDATVLITDWKLNEGASGRRAVNYQADRLIREIRNKRPAFPIFVVTGFKEMAHPHLSHVEGLFSRNDFTTTVDTILPQMLRAGQRRYDEQRLLLSKLETLARSVASGEATVDERERLQGLQGYFQTDLPTIINLDGVLSEFESLQRRADALRKKIQARLDKPTRRRT